MTVTLPFLVLRHKIRKPPYFSSIQNGPNRNGQIIKIASVTSRISHNEECTLTLEGVDRGCVELATLTLEGVDRGYRNLV
jgi:hypothetical protein